MTRSLPLLSDFILKWHSLFASWGSGLLRSSSVSRRGGLAGRMRLETLAACLTVIAMASTAASGVSAQVLTLSPAPGESESFTLRISNPTSAPIHPVAVHVSHWDSAWNLDVSAAPPCRWRPGGGSTSLLTAPILEANSSLECTITVHRNAQPQAYSSSWYFSPANGTALQMSPQKLRIGAFADLRFSLTPVLPYPRRGATTAYFRLAAVHTGDFAVTSASAMTCVLGQRFDYALDGDFPGGCEFSESSPNGLCWLHGSHEENWVLPDLPAGGESSCLIRMTAPHGLKPGMGEIFSPMSGLSAEGYVVVDETREDLMLPLAAVVTDAAIPSLSRMSMILLASLVAALAWPRMRAKNGPQAS